jgi:small-conductance mechanosensitive channel
MKAAAPRDVKNGFVMARAFTEMIAATSSLFVIITAFTAGSYTLSLLPVLRTVITSLFIIAFVLQATVWASVALTAALEAYAQRRGDGRATRGATSIIVLMARAVLWSIALLLILDNLGFDVTALMAGLGIGGIAIGLAAQSILGDLFASLSIVLDKPFEIGDFVVTGDHMGTVERIGLKTTRLRSLSGEQVVISNADLLASRIRNYKRMAERRVVFAVAVVYGTPQAKLAMIPQMIRAIIEAQKQTRFDRCHFASYSDYALSFEIAYYVLSADYNEHMDTLQAINLAIYQRFTEEGICFALRTGSAPAPMERVAAAQR